MTIDLAGVVGSWSRSADDNAAIPGEPNNGGPCGATGLGSSTTGSSQNCFRYAFASGSSVTIHITGSDVTMLGGSLIVDAIQPIVFDTIVLTIHQETTIASGATGALDGDVILWTTPAYISTAGTIECTGPNCGLIPMPEGVEFALEPQFSLLSNSVAAPRLQLVYWILDPSHTTIVASTTAANRWSNVLEDSNRRMGGFTFGPTLLGFPISCGESVSPPGCESWYDPPPWSEEAPEPGLAALLVLGIGALSLCARRAGSR